VKPKEPEGNSVLYGLEYVKSLGKGKHWRIFIAGNYRDSAALGLLDKMAHWIRSFKKDVFYPIMMKDFEIPSVGKEPGWFQEFIRDTLTSLISKEERDVLTPKQTNEVASNIYVVENCGYIFSELTTFGGGGPLAESIVAYVKGLRRYVFMKEGHRLNPMLIALVSGSNQHHYSDEDNLRQLINTILRTILTER